MLKQVTIALLLSATSAIDFSWTAEETNTMKNNDVDIIQQVTDAAKSADLNLNTKHMHKSQMELQAKLNRLGQSLDDSLEAWSKTPEAR